jgi:hypothetical protein
MGTAKAISFGLFPHTSGRRDPADRLHTTTTSPFPGYVTLGERWPCTVSVRAGAVKQKRTGLT